MSSAHTGRSQVDKGEDDISKAFDRICEYVLENKFVALHG
jgi:hypothetical protein